MRPKIQLALDCDNTEQAIKACQGGVVDEVDIIETGYCLIASEGARVVKLFREMYPNKPLVADFKIVDAGKKISGMLLEGKPDYTTILCACEKGTITGVRDEVKARGLNTKLQMELYGHWSFDDIPMWIENGIKTIKGEVNVIYVGPDGNIIETKQESGREGKVYQTEELTYENMKLSGVTDNTQGVFGKLPIYVIYSYDNLSITEKPVMPVVMILCASSAATLMAALILGVVYGKKKKKYR